MLHYMLFFAFTVACPQIADPTNGRIVGDATVDSVGSTLTFQCNAGYSLVGATTITCQDNGQWDPSPPFCTGTRHQVLKYMHLSRIYTHHGKSFGGFSTIINEVLLRSGGRGWKGAIPSQVCKENSHLKNGHRIWRLVFHVSCNPSCLKFVDPLPGGL